MTKLMMMSALAVISAGAAAIQTASAEVPAAIAEPNATIVATLHAEGAQVYQCGRDAQQKLVWQFREPIATLIADSATVGRHFAGPNWELADGSAITGKAAASVPGTTSSDIPWLKLTVSAHRGSGKLATVDIVQRINTRGGVATRSCDTVGQFLSVPYSADYSFLHKD